MKILRVAPILLLIVVVGLLGVLVYTQWMGTQSEKGRSDAEAEAARLAQAPITVIAPDGTKITAPAGTPVGWSETDSGSDMGGREQADRSASGEGASLNTTSETAAQQFDNSSPVVWLPDGMGAQGGTTQIKQSLKGVGAEKALRGYAFWVGLLLIAIAAVLWNYGRIQSAKYAAIAGAACVAIAFYPGLIVVVLASALIVNFWPQIRAEIDAIRASAQAKKLLEAGRAMAGGVENLPAEIVVPPSATSTAVAIRSRVKAEVRAQAEPQDIDTIREIKAIDGLPSERH